MPWLNAAIKPVAAVRRMPPPRRGARPLARPRQTGTAPHDRNRGPIIPDHASESFLSAHRETATFPAPLAGGSVHGHLDRFGPELIDGWAIDTASPSNRVQIDIVEHGCILGHVTADIWRTDLQEVRQGDGRWGFTARPPAALADGADHLVDLLLPGGEPLLPGPIRVRFHPGTAGAPLPLLRPLNWEPDPPYRTRPGPAPQSSAITTLISVIVVFYNMGREAARTLTSLTRAYQQGAETLGYEVICIDNGSAEPLDADWVASFGPEFRLIRANPARPSPVALMNQAARQARGHHLALMIDGAHILSPGVFREAADAIAEAPNAAIGLRQWFIGGDQRFLARSGWTREQENMLFDRIAWPADGYGLFRIATPVWESPNHWFDGMSETNCLFVPAETFKAIGGFDEAFSEPGAGYANLDLFRRVHEAGEEPMVALIGEASFHQFHEGTTTNVADDEKERRVRGYAYKYACLRGKPWVPIHAGQLRLRGHIRTRTALVARQRPLSPANIGVTTAVRPAHMSTHLDQAAGDYLISAYAEAGLQDTATWRGETLGVAPPDALAIAAILHERRPTRVVAVNLAAGLLRLVQDSLRLNSNAAALVTVGRGTARIQGDPCAADTLRDVQIALGAATDVVVIYGAGPSDENLLAGLHAYAPFVSLRSYLVVAGSALGQPWLGYSRAWTMKAINSFADVMPFSIDRTRTNHLITSCPLGFLQRIGPVEAGTTSGLPDLVGIS